MNSKIITLKEAFDLDVSNGFVVAGDIHLYDFYPYSTRNEGMSSRLIDLKETMHEIGLISRMLGLPMILNGDVLHTGILDYYVEFVLTEFLMEYDDVNTFINLGNHDIDGGVSVLEPLVNVARNAKHLVVTKPTKYGISNHSTFYFMPYFSDVQTLAKLKRLIIKINPNVYNTLFIHNSFSGALFANKEQSKHGISQKAAPLKRFDLVVASHIHKYQEICNGNGFYTSSLVPLNFGEKSKEHGYHIVDIGNNIRYFVIPKAPKFIYLRQSIYEALSKQDLTKKVKGNFICIKEDVKDKPINKANTRNRLLSCGALFITFKNIITHRLQVKEVKATSENIKDIVASYSSHLAQEYKLKPKTMQETGLTILTKAEKLVSQKLIRR